MNPNTYCTEEHEIRIRTLFWKLILNWKLIILAACVFAVLGYGYAKYEQHSHKQTASQAVIETEDGFLDYSDVEEKTYETIDRYEAALNNEQNYVQNSLLMQMDPYHMVSTVQDFEVRAEENVDINELTMVGRQLVSLATSMETVGIIAEKYGCDPQYIRELIGAGSRENQYDLNGVKINTGASSSELGLALHESGEEKYYFYVNAKSNDKQFTIDAVQIIADCIQRKADEITQIEFTVKPVGLYTNETVDLGVISTQNDSRVRAFDYSDRLVKLKTIIDNLEKAKASSNAPDDTKHISGKKYAMFGFLGGAILMAFILILRSIRLVTIQTEEDFRSYFTVSSLGTAPIGGGQKRIKGLKTEILEKLEGSSSRQSIDTFYRMTGINVVNAVQKSKSVLFTGSVAKDSMQALEERLMPLFKEKCGQVAFTFAEDLIGNPETRANLQTTDSIVLVEKRNYSKVENVREELEVIAALDKKVLGVILL